MQGKEMSQIEWKNILAIHNLRHKGKFLGSSRIACTKKNEKLRNWERLQQNCLNDRFKVSKSAASQKSNLIQTIWLQIY